MGVGLVGRTLGSLGIGNIGAEVFRLAKPFDMKFIAHDPFADKAVAAELGIELVGLEDLFRRADVLSVSCPLTPETRHIVNAERLALMKPTAYLINTARGPIVDQKALTKVLQERRIAGAGLDVLEQEPPDAGRSDPQARQRHPRAARAVLDRPVLRRQRRGRRQGGARRAARPRAARRRQPRRARHARPGSSGWPASARRFGGRGAWTTGADAAAASTEGPTAAPRRGTATERAGGRDGANRMGGTTMNDRERRDFRGGPRGRGRRRSCAASRPAGPSSPASAR